MKVYPAFPRILLDSEQNIPCTARNTLRSTYIESSSMAIIDSTQVSFVTSVFVCILILVCVKPSDQSGSTPHVKDIFLGRCWDFQSQKFPPSSESRKNCTKIWDIFYRAFAYKDPCNLTFDDYEPYFAAVGGSDIVNKVCIYF